MSFRVVAARGPVRKIWAVILQHWVCFRGNVPAVSIFRAVFFLLPQSLQAQLKPQTPADAQRVELFLLLSAFLRHVKAQIMMENGLF